MQQIQVGIPITFFNPLGECGATSFDLNFVFGKVVCSSDCQGVLMDDDTSWSA